MSRYISSLALGVVLCGGFPSPGIATEPAATTVIVVRHAEKTPEAEAPGLTLTGQERSHRLRDLTIDSGVTALYASQFRRTQETVAPLAAALGLEVKIVDAGDTTALVAKILGEHGGGVVVVAGHSNTVPAIVAALGAPEPAEIPETDYDNLFIVTVSGPGRATALRMRY